VNAYNGSLVWKYRAGPGDEKIVGNGRIISIWPVRTSVLVDDDQVFFGAGVFPLRCSIALVNKPKKVTGNWTVLVTHGVTTPVKHLTVNFGAPGDMKADDGTSWFGYPRPKKPARN